MRTYCCQHYSKGNISKFIFAAIAILSSSKLVAISPSSPLTHDGELLFLHREIRLVESESLRVAVTIDALQEELQENYSREYIEQLHSVLGNLYKYDVQLDSHYRDLKEEWASLQYPEGEPAMTKLNDYQIRPIPIINRSIYEALHEDAMPITGFSPININVIDKLTP